MGGGSARRDGHDRKGVHKGRGKGGGKGGGKRTGRGDAPHGKGDAPHGPARSGGSPIVARDIRADCTMLPGMSTKYMIDFVTWPRFASKYASPPTLVYHPQLHGGSPVAAAVWIAPIDALIYSSDWLNVVQANVCNSTCINPICCPLHSCSYSKFPQHSFFGCIPYLLLGCRSSKFEV